MERPRVLVVIEQPELRTKIRSILSTHGYVVMAETGDGVTALVMARDQVPDMVIIDDHISRMDALQVARVLAEEEIAPVVFITSARYPGVVDLARETGLVNPVFKPMRTADLVSAMEVGRTMYQRLHALVAEVNRLKETLEVRKVVDRAKGVLMQRHGLNESEAHARLQAIAMNQRKSVREVAVEILAR